MANCIIFYWWSTYTKNFWLLLVFDVGYFCGNGHILSIPSDCNMGSNILRLCLAEGKLWGQKSGGVTKLELRDLSSCFSFCVELPARSSYSRHCHLKLSWLCCALNFHCLIAKSEEFFICQFRYWMESASLQQNRSGWTGSDSWVCTEEFPYAEFSAVRVICLNLDDENTVFNPLVNFNPSLHLDFT